MSLMTAAFFFGLTESVDAKYSKPCSFAYSAVFVNLVLMQTAQRGPPSVVSEKPETAAR